LSHLELSFNNMKEEPVEFYKYLSEQNQLVELNLAYTDLDVDKFFYYMSRGGCDQNLKKLILNGNCTFSKISNTEHLSKFVRSVNALTHLELSCCKLPGSIIQIILANLKWNNYIKNGFYLNLSMNDLGSCIKTFMYEFNSQTCLTSLDLSENSLFGHRLGHSNQSASAQQNKKSFVVAKFPQH